MIQVGPRDRIFVAVVAPLALLTGYVYFVRQPLDRERRALAAEQARLPDPDMFPSERRPLRDRVTAAEKALADVRAEKVPEAEVRGRVADSEAARQQAVFDVFHAHGVRVAKAEPVEATGVCADTLRATGVRPAPVARRFALEASYPALVAALKALETARLAVIPGRWMMTPAETACRWEVTLWL